MWRAECPITIVLHFHNVEHQDLEPEEEKGCEQSDEVSGLTVRVPRLDGCSASAASHTLFMAIDLLRVWSQDRDRGVCHDDAPKDHVVDEEEARGRVQLILVRPHGPAL
eukprot:CAMPEP_0178459860 /NCGR_PEP_ID=MMETSP0689_2-20121128/48367_1 /TAXON_ID=160604 /ORGANISM="Amphidinium massartii, Strain CS-259" /LENGTH=108 /DNA_ID=CAMNT_0020086389 /DNA_START=743 /DNA_END=1066 /DNA_ORIENTATION=-